jgi:hypothetical protein
MITALTKAALYNLGHRKQVRADCASTPFSVTGAVLARRGSPGHEGRSFR